MIQRPLPMAFRTAVIALLLSGAIAGPQSKLVRQAGAGTSAPFEMPPEKFLALEKTLRPLDPAKLDHTWMAAALLHETNLRRRKAGKDALRHDPRLVEASRRHASSMAEKNFFSHIHPGSAELRTPRDRALRAGFTPLYIAENIATHFGIRYTPGKAVYQVRTRKGQGFSYQAEGSLIPPHTYASFASSLLDQWMNSPEHRQNILAEAPERYGSGCAQGPSQGGMPVFYCVQLFGTPRK